MHGSSLTPNLVPGNTYFIVMYEDEQLTIPVVQTLVFTEKGKLDDGSPCFFFLELRSGGEKSKFFVHEQNAKDLLLDLPGVIERLKEGLSRKT